MDRMTTTAYVLIEGASDQTPAIVRALQRVKGVKSAHAVTGPYDVIACVEAKDVGAVGSIVLSKIRTLKGVTKTVTCVAV
jgi:DNA-binding Lrp family transcriptional regulator